MPWTAPEVTRPEPTTTGGEKESLLGFLEYHRATLLQKCAGLTGEQLAARPIPPSTLSLLGLVRHLTDVERGWVLRRVLGKGLDFHYYKPDEADPDRDFNEIVPEHAERDYALYIEETAGIRAALADVSLEQTFEHREHGTMTARWVLLHLIEEYARHNGHADLLRELIDGATGE